MHTHNTQMHTQTTPLSEGKKNSKGTTIRETIDCCDEDLCKHTNRERERERERKLNVPANPSHVTLCMYVCVCVCMCTHFVACGVCMFACVRVCACMYVRVCARAEYLHAREREKERLC